MIYSQVSLFNKNPDKSISVERPIDKLFFLFMLINGIPTSDAREPSKLVPLNRHTTVSGPNST